MKGKFQLYLYDEVVRKILINKYAKSSVYGYMGFAIQYCFDNEYIKHLRVINGHKENEFGIKEPLLVPISDSDKINNSMLSNIEIFDFYFNKEKFSKHLIQSIFPRKCIWLYAAKVLFFIYPHCH